VSFDVEEIVTTPKTRTNDRGVPFFENEPKTLPELFVQATEKLSRPDAFCFKQDGEWKHISSAKALERIGNIALGLYSLGLRKGDKAAILSSNSPDWTFADGGCQFAGIVDVPIYTTLAENSIEYILKDAEPRVFFLQDLKTYERVKRAIAACGTIEKIILFDPKEECLENGISLAELEKAGEELGATAPFLLRDLSEKAKPDEIATLIYTSGTTGEPKGVMLSHTNIISNAIDAGSTYDFSDRDTCLSVLPLSHIFERTGMYLYIMNGMSVHYAESVEKVPDNLQEVRPTLFIGVPRIFEKVYAVARLKAAQSSRLRERIFDWAIEIAKEYALRLENMEAVPVVLALERRLADRLVYRKMREFFGGNLKFCVTGGAALSDDIWLIFTGAGIPIMQGYGLTETSPVISSSWPRPEPLKDRA